MKNKIKRLICLNIWFILAIYIVQSQPDYKTPIGVHLTNIPSPTAGSLGQYGDIPVSFFTGSADISVPIYTLSGKGVELPISLRYDASGIRPNTLPSWVGQNWSLNAGGVIVRSRNGAPDEMQGSDYTNYLQHPNTIVNRIAEWGKKRGIIFTLYDELTDYEADVFTFNFMGKTGKFFMGNDGQWKVYSESNLEVIFDVDDEFNYAFPFYNNNPNTSGTFDIKTIYGFRLRDEEGTVYEFGYDIEAIEYDMDFFRQNPPHHTEINYLEASPWDASSWYLTSVKDRHGNLLYALQYNRGCYIAHFTYYYEQNGSSLSGSSNNGDFPYSGTLISPVYLTSITSYMQNINVYFGSSDIPELHDDEFENKLVGPQDDKEMCRYFYLQADDPNTGAFFYGKDPVTYQYTGNNEIRTRFPLTSTGLKKLDMIRVVASSSESKAYVFEYNDYHTQRLNLQKIHLYQGINKYPTSAKGYLSSYRFTYNYFEGLPWDHLTRKVDHWGYYNGNNVPLIPNSSSLYNLREPNSNCLIGLLTEIQYPTDGRSVFEYEPHYYSKVAADNRQSMVKAAGNVMAGGVRIKSITDYDGTTRLKRRTYKYTFPNSTTSSGELFAKPKYGWEGVPLMTVGGSDLTNFIFRSSSVIPLFNFFGNHIGYSYVEEHTDTGYTRYRYSNMSDDDAVDFTYIAPVGLSPYTKYCDRGYRRGKLLETSVYDEDDTLKQRTVYTYRSDNVENNFVITSNLSLMPVAGYPEPDTSINFIKGSVYKLFYPKYDVVQKEVYTYNGTTPTVENYLYDKTDVTLSLTNPTRSATVRTTTAERITINGKERKTTYSYPFQNSPAMGSALTQQFYLQPIATAHYIDNILIEGSRYQYQLSDSGKVVPQYLYKYYRSSSNAIPAVTYTSYSSKGTLLAYQELGKPKTALLWGYQENYLLGVARNVPSTTLNLYAAVPPSIRWNSTPNRAYLIDLFSDFRTNNPAIQLTSYTHHSLFGVTSITDPNNTTIYYDYDDFGRLNAIKDLHGDILETYQYKYRYSNPPIDPEEPQEPEEPKPLQCVLYPPDRFRLNIPGKVQAATTGGSGSYAHKWTLKQGEMIVKTWQTGANNIADVTLTQNRNDYSLLHIVNDLITLEADTTTCPLYIKEYPLYFIVKEKYIDSRGNSWIRAVISFENDGKAPHMEADLTLRVGSKTTCRFIIGENTDKEETYTLTGRDELTVCTTFDYELPVKMQFMNAVEPDASICITSASELIGSPGCLTLESK
jgi:YD repeat-containing protein